VINFFAQLCDSIAFIAVKKFQGAISRINDEKAVSSKQKAVSRKQLGINEGKKD
jgi:hypothetical protein